MIAILYGSTTGKTEEIADELQKHLPDSRVFDISDFPLEELGFYDVLVLGTSTWGTGDLQDSWADHLEELAACDLTDKTLAFFGLGDQKSFTETFVGGLAKLYDRLAPLAKKVIGNFRDKDFSFEDCLAYREGAFVGLVIDDDNQASKTDERINRWVSQLLTEV